MRLLLFLLCHMILCEAVFYECHCSFLFQLLLLKFCFSIAADKRWNLFQQSVNMSNTVQALLIAVNVDMQISECGHSIIDDAFQVKEHFGSLPDCRRQFWDHCCHWATYANWVNQKRNPCKAITVFSIFPCLMMRIVSVFCCIFSKDHVVNKTDWSQTTLSPYLTIRLVTLQVVKTLRMYLVDSYEWFWTLLRNVASHLCSSAGARKSSALLYKVNDITAVKCLLHIVANVVFTCESECLGYWHDSFSLSELRRFYFSRKYCNFTALSLPLLSCVFTKEFQHDFSWKHAEIL